MKKRKEKKERKEKNKIPTSLSLEVLFKKFRRSQKEEELKIAAQRLCKS